MDYSLSSKLFSHWLPTGVFGLSVHEFTKDSLRGSGIVITPDNVLDLVIKSSEGEISIEWLETQTPDIGVLKDFNVHPFTFRVDQLHSESFVRISLNSGNGFLPRAFWNTWSFCLGNSGIEYPPKETIARTNGSGDLLVWKTIGATVYWNTTQILERFLPSFSQKTTRIMEWGCGCGNAARFFLNDNRFEYYGMDVDPIGIK